MKLLKYFFLFLFLLTFPTLATTVQQPHATAELISEVESIQPGQPFWVGLHLIMEEHWHSYWQNPGDSGLATTIQWQLPKGFTAGPILWPIPKKIESEGLVSYIYENEVLLLTQITPPSELLEKNITLHANADWLVCKEACIPGHAELALTFPVTTNNPFSNPKWEKLFKETRNLISKSSEGWIFKIEQQNKNFLLHGERTQSNLHIPDQLEFFPFHLGLIELTTTPIYEKQPNGFTLQFDVASPLKERTFSGLLVQTYSWNSSSQAISTEINLPFNTQPTLTSSSSSLNLTFWSGILFAFVGGLILNLMPCVFPILSIKILGYVQQAQENKSVLRKHGWAFALGVVVSFWILSGLLLILRATGEKLGWGFQLQSPWFVILMTYLLFLLSLNLFGVFELGTSLMRVGGKIKGKGYGSSFGSGVLATAVATPCTAPFMGAALSFALSQPPFISFFVFTVLAVGLALPYVILCHIPAVLKLLPRPGTWMATFKQLMAFPMLGAVVWLLWVTSFQKGSEGVLLSLCGLLAIALACWIYGKWTTPITPQKIKFIALSFALGLLSLSFYFGIKISRMQKISPSLQETSLWQPYSEQRIAELRTQGKPIFIDFTAAWCFTCQVNKAVALHNSAVMKKFQEKGVTLFQADWTNRDPQITQALEFYHRTGVPTYVFYNGTPNATPQILPEILTPQIVLMSLEQLKK
jgi:thiol:disulfide interchange protein/DsbC/DsbD-like thiol-disulfide interchange protein